MSNLESEPQELVCADAAGAAIEILEPRAVPLGGPRAMEVRRTLPQRSRSLIGAWCFVDHYGPEQTRMLVPPHPHTGLQTVSWLFSGEIEHNDSTGAHRIVRPGELNLMTAGRGISHSEVSLTDGDTLPTLHGAQLWLALPEEHRHRAPFFEHYEPVPFAFDGATITVFLGSLAGDTSTATMFSPLVGAQIDIPAGHTVRIPVDADFEHGVLVDAGDVSVDGVEVTPDHLAYAAPGRDGLVIGTTGLDARVLLIGGAPFGEQIVMWWNFIGRDHDEIVEYRAQWQHEVIEGADPEGRFGTVDYDGDPLPAPVLPTVHLKPRG